MKTEKETKKIKKEKSKEKAKKAMQNSQTNATVLGWHNKPPSRRALLKLVHTMHNHGVEE